MQRRETEEIEGGGGALSFERMYSAVSQRVLLIAAVTSVAAGIGTAIALALPIRFEAASIVQIDPRKKSISAIDSVLSELRADSATVESEVEVVRSNTIILQTIEKLGLRSDPEFAGHGSIAPSILSFFRSSNETDGTANQNGSGATPPTAKSWLRPEDAATKTQSEPDRVARAVYKHLKVDRVRNTLLIEIRFSSSDPAKAALIANTIAELYINDQLEMKTKAAGHASEALEQKIREMKEKVAIAERRVSDFKARNNIFDSEGHLLEEKELARLMEQSVLARNALAEARAKYEQAQLMSRLGATNDDNAAVLSSHTISVFKRQLATVARRQAELKTKYGPRHPDIVRVNAEVSQARRQLQSEIKKLVANLKTEYEVAKRRQAGIDLAIARIKDQDRSVRSTSSQLNELQREAATEKQLYEALLARFRATTETRELQLPDARIVETASVPLHRASPKRMQIIVIAVAFGLALGVALAILLELAIPGIAVPEDVEQILSIPHLSSVPLIAPPPGQRPDPAQRTRLVLSQPNGLFAESIRGLRREIDVRRRNGAPQIVLVASSLPGESTEDVASNLAHHFALTRNRVLLIDGDLRMSPLTRRLTPHRPPGIADMLVRNQSVEHAILQDATTGLHFLPGSGPARLSTSAPELLTSAPMSTFLSGLRNQYETIILQAPPLLPVIDGRILADHANQIVFVMTWRKTPKKLARRALKTLGHNQRKIAGAVVNKVDPAILDEASRFNLTLALPRQIKRRAA